MGFRERDYEGTRKVSVEGSGGVILIKPHLEDECVYVTDRLHGPTLFVGYGFLIILGPLSTNPLDSMLSDKPNSRHCQQKTLNPKPQGELHFQQAVMG